MVAPTMLFGKLLDKLEFVEVRGVVISSKEITNMTGHEAGRQLLAEMYRELTGKELPRICVTDRGKPYFPEEKLHFSISHTKNRVFCALSERPVGIDAEQRNRPVNLLLADKILSPGERQRYDRAEDKRKALLRLWVLKEAAAKLSGRGWGSYLYSTDFDPADSRVQEIDGCYLAVVEE